MLRAMLKHELNSDNNVIVTCRDYFIQSLTIDIRLNMLCFRIFAGSDVGTF